VVARRPDLGLAAVRGTLDLLLLVAVLASAWTRTSVGALLESAAAFVRHEERPDLLASFRTALPQELAETIERLPTTPPSSDSGFSPALRTAIAARLGDAALGEIDSALDPEAALETWAIGTAARDRAIDRARASGSPAPDRYENHRTFLANDDRRNADRAVADVLALATALDLIWPVDPSAPIASPFGERRHPILGIAKLHEGVDIAVPTGTPVRAAGSGTVERAREDGVNGRYVRIDHGHDVATSYCHASSLAVAERDPVDRGALILHSGATGRATGPHLHFGLRIRGRAVDPLTFRALTPPSGSP
jgi:murein DD-endopeptidase MepM/ murein hydrolase activator NlpD